MYPALFEKVIEFHGHCCPGIAYGYRAALAALDEFEDRSADEELVAIVENDSCSIDAVQVITGCTFGKGNLIFFDYGKQVYTFFSRKRESGMRFSVNSIRMEETASEREAWKSYAEGNRSREVWDMIERQKKRKIEFLLSMPKSELFKIEPSSKSLPNRASLYRSVVCELCSEKMMEPRARLKNGKTVCIPCFET